jgi:thymidine kinase
MVQLIIGSMFSGKTSELLRRLERYSIAGKKVCLIRPECDTREFLTHDNQSTNKNGIKIYQGRFSSIGTDLFTYDVIGVDEGQFFDNLSVVINILSENPKLIIIISALNADTENKMFDAIINLIPHCDTITKLNAVCMECGSDFGNYNVCMTSKSNRIKIGGKDMYKVLCHKCYDQFKLKV